MKTRLLSKTIGAHSPIWAHELPRCGLLTMFRALGIWAFPPEEQASSPVRSVTTYLLFQTGRHALGRLVLQHSGFTTGQSNGVSSPSKTYIAMSGTMRASQHKGSFQVSSSFISL